MNEILIPTIVLQCITIISFFVTIFTFYHNLKKQRDEDVKLRIDAERSKTEERTNINRSIQDITEELKEIKAMLQNSNLKMNNLENRVTKLEAQVLELSKNCENVMLGKYHNN